MGWMGWMAVGLIAWLVVGLALMSFPILGKWTDQRDEIIKRREAADRRDAAIAEWRKRHP